MKNHADNTAVLSGCGWVTPLAAGSIIEVARAARRACDSRAERRGFHPIPDGWIHDYADLAKELRRDKGAAIAAMAATHALQASGLDRASLDRRRIGIVLGCGLAGQPGMIQFAEEVRGQSARFVSPIHFPQTVGNYTAAALARGFDLTGPNLTLACGPASGLVAIAEGCRLIADGRADVVLAGGVEHLTDALAASLCPPGGWVSEGACLFVIERGEHAADRSVDLLASVTTLDDSDAYTAAPSDDNAADKVTNTTDAGGAGTSGSLVSTAAQARPGAIFIEQWIGHCFGAGGSAAVAAALAAMAGEEVPLVGGGAGDSIVPGRIDLEGHGGGKRMTAMIEAPTDSGGLSRLSVTTLGGG